MTARRRTWEPEPPDLGHLAILMLAGSMSGLRDRLYEGGYGEAAELVADLVEIADDYLMRPAS